MGKVTFVTKFATFGCVKLVAQSGFNNWRRRSIGEGWWNRVSPNLRSNRIATNIDQLRDSFKATRNIMQEVASFTKWTAGGAA